ncbi:MAG TPA: hypothetical protein PL077_05380 [Treponemataceae bacterium]|nr:hypothetical protein [Treponemataceae bacterium]
MKQNRIAQHFSHLLLPLSVLAILVVINLIKGADYFSVKMINGALYGNIPNMLFGASELVILSIGMTLVTASSRGQDISVGVAAAITSAVFVQFLLQSSEITWMTIFLCFLISCGVAVAIGGNALSGGKFSITGSIIGAYTIEMLSRTLLRLEVGTETIKAFKAVFIIILMIISSPAVREYFARARMRTGGGSFGDIARKNAAPDAPAKKEA